MNLYQEHMYLMHYGIKRRSGRYKYGTGDRPYQHTVFISGSSKTQSKDSEYYRKRLPREVRKKIDEYIKNGDKIIVGDAPGIDRQVQKYLKDYNNVEVYGPGKKVRYSENPKWKTNPIDASEFEEGSPEWLRKKDIAMTNAADKGLAVVLDEGAKATRNNVERLRSQNKSVDVYQLSKNGKRYDRFENFDPYQAMNRIDKSLSKKEQNLLGVGNNNANAPIEKFFFDKDLTSYLITTDYHGKFKDEHPIDGKIIGIAAKKEVRGTGTTDKLINDAKEFYKGKKLVAEIDKDNTASRKLFERNGFKKEYDDGFIDYYTYKSKKG